MVSSRLSCGLLSVLIGSWVMTTSVFGQFGLEFSGETNWDSRTATLKFVASGTMPETKEGFFWQVPPEVKTVIILRGVTVKGGFRVQYRDPSNPLRIIGEDRKTSIIYGTDDEKWTVKNNVADSDKWKYGSISVIEDAVVHVANITAMNPRGYNVSGYANRAVVHVFECNLLDTRKGDNNNSDGFAGASGSSIRESLISTSDDGIKVYHDISIENVTIEQHRNGAPLQFGWGGENESVTATISNLTIKGVDPEDQYNMAPFTWERGQDGVRNVVIDGLKIDVRGRVYDEESGQWQPIGLFELKPRTCTFNLNAKNCELGGLPMGLKNTSGTVVINGMNID